jgi:predicted NUDIX family NTP pyrophosphohydrolase
MPLVSAGCVVIRESARGPEVLLVHPKRATFRRPVFGIPKGLVEAGEDLEATAARETLEETGLHVRIVAALGSVRQKSGKVVHAFHAVVDDHGNAPAAIDDLGRCRFADGENDVARFYPIDKAYNLMIPAQRAFLDRLQGREPRPAPMHRPSPGLRKKPAARRRGGGGTGKGPS